MPRPCPRIQDAVQQVLDRAIAEDRDSALQVAAWHQGVQIVDAWSACPGLQVDGDTLFPFFSTGKGLAATAVHRLVERGVLGWDDPICRYWPEFAANGKAGIRLRHALNHTAGLAMMPERGDRELAADWSGMCRFLAESPALHPAGDRRHYHAITYSWLVGETASRADGRPFARIFQEEVCRPLGIDRLFFGLSEAAMARAIDAEAPPPPPPAAAGSAPPDPVAQRAIPSWVWPLEDWINHPVIRAACIPASNGFGNARAVARHYAALIGSGADGFRLLSDATVAAATAWTAIDAATPGNGRWGLGYGLQGPDEDPGVCFGHGGHGGSTGFADRRLGLAVAVLRRRMGGSPVADEVVRTIREHLT